MGCSRPNTSQTDTIIFYHILTKALKRFYNTRWFKYDRDYLCVNKSQFVPVIFEPPCTFRTGLSPKSVDKDLVGSDHAFYVISVALLAFLL